MQYAILCYADETVTTGWSKEKDAEVMNRLASVQDRLTKDGRLGPVARLMPTGQARTLTRKAGEAMVVDGPFAETKEQFLGFYVVDMPTIEDALDWARELSKVNPSGGSYEVRPVMAFFPHGAPAGTRA